MSRRGLQIFLLMAVIAALVSGCAGSRKSTHCDTSETVASQGVSAAEEAKESEAAEEDEGAFEDPFAEPSFDENGEKEEAANDISDPLEPLNRAFFAFNDKFYFWVAKPIARGWRKAVPEKARIGFGNVLTNLLTPIRLVNNVLQLDFLGAMEETTRFVANTTMGLGGWFDLAAENGLPIDEEDFGQTLGNYGVGHGFYLVVPFLGPSSLRDSVGDAFDFYLYPFNYTPDLIGGSTPNEEVIAFKAVKIENTLSLDKDTYEKVVKESIDPYLFMRNAYFQLRESCLNK